MKKKWKRLKGPAEGYGFVFGFGFHEGGFIFGMHVIRWGFTLEYS